MAQDLVHNYVKHYPDFYKIIEYKQPRLVGNNEELFNPEKYFNVLDKNYYYSNLPVKLKKIRDLFNPVEIVDIKPPVVNLSFDFLNDRRSQQLWAEYQRKVDDSSIIKTSDALNASIRRSKRMIKDLIHCNQFDMWVTFTFKQQLYDIDLAKKRISQWFQDQQKQYGTFCYLAVPEFHKSGALHFHALLKDYKGVVVPALSPKTGRQIVKKGRKIYNIKSFGRGFTQLEYIESSVGVCNYISKYITKNSPVLSGKRRYFHSKGLKKPLCESNSIHANNIKKSLYYENELFRISYLSKDKNQIDLIDIPF